MATKTTKMDEKEFEKLVVELAKKGMTSEKIGLVLKKDHGIPKTKKVYGKRISQILKENKVYVDPDTKNLKVKVDRIKKHLAKNKNDKNTKRAYSIKEAKLRKLLKLQK